MSYAMGESLQAAIYGHLLADAAVSGLVGADVYDDVPDPAPALFVALGPEKASAVPDSGGTGAVHRLQISVVTTGAGYLAAKAVAVAVSDALTGAELTLTRGRLVSLQFQRADVRRDKTEGTRRIDLTFRARTDDTGV